jgi:eukaryotic-like serine/threonine-protein kinase
MTAEIGRVLGGRYRLVAPIGMGASAQVYLADDVKLRRRVALKMLHDALAGDAEFLRRFRAEARAAAALSHPNIMAVYDWNDGSDAGESAFIVTEYLPGGSLRALLDAGGQLSPAQALGVGLEAARALDYAHRRGFVHRDIKPANLLFGEDQRLRIADFGLARALAEAAWTEPQGAVLGTARYASPEQAKGERLSGKADVYALALVLIEAVTGEVPFVADTTLGTLMARVDKPVPVADELGPLQSVLVGAGHPDPEERIDARTLAKGFLRAARELSRPGPLPLAGALAAGAAQGLDPDPTVHAPGPLGSTAGADRDEPEPDLTADDLDLDPPHWVNQSDPDPVVMAVPGPGTELLEETAPPVAEDRGLGAVALDEEPDPGPATSPVPVIVDVDRPAVDRNGSEVDGHVGADPATPSADGRRRRWPWVLLALVVLGAAGGGVAAALAAREAGPAGPALLLPIPDLVFRTEPQATAVLEAAGWRVTVVRERRDGTIRGLVLATAPEPGARLGEGRRVTLTVSAGQTIVDVPSDLAGRTVEEATATLAEVGFEGEVVEERFDEDVRSGSVIEVASGTPTRLEKGSTVGLVVSRGPEPRTIPAGLVGGSEEAAVAALEALGLRPEVVRSYSDTAPEGQVISVLPAVGQQAERGAVVSVEVSRGREPVTIPSVSGAGSIAGAIGILEGVGLVAGTVSGPASGTPQGTDPPAGTAVAPGSTIDIILG